jgi:hypothetical protein
MRLQVAWSKLDMSRASIMGLLDGKFINATSDLGERFLLAFGHDRHRYKVIFINSNTGEQFIRFCDTNIEAEEVASKFAYGMQQVKSNELINYLNFQQLR